MAATVTVTTAAGTVRRAKAQGWIRGLCPCCGSDVVAVIRDGENVHTCLAATGEERTCSFQLSVPFDAAIRPARLPDGRRYFRPWLRAYRTDTATAPPLAMAA